MLQKLLLQSAPRLDKERAIDGFVGHLHAPLLWVGPFEPTGDLLRRPSMLQFASHDLRQGWIARQLARLGAVRTLPGCFIGARSPVATLATVAVKLTADSGCSSPQARGNAVDGFARSQCPRDLLALSESQCQS